VEDGIVNLRLTDFDVCPVDPWKITPPIFLFNQWVNNAFFFMDQTINRFPRKVNLSTGNRYLQYSPKPFLQIMWPFLGLFLD
jgi:hypothetical protein